MNPHRQLLRQPIRTLAMLFLLCVVSAFLCLGFGVLKSAEETGRAIDSEFVTIALPADGGHTDENGGGAWWGTTKRVPDYMRALLNSCTTIKNLYYQHFVSGYSPAFSPVVSASEEGKYSYQLDMPYDSAVLLVTLTDIQESTGSGTFPSVILMATVDQVLAMHGDYEVRDTLKINYTYYFQEELDRVGLRVGGQYLIYGTDYRDLDLELRTRLATFYGCSTEDINWDYLGVTEVNVEGKTEYPAAYRLPGRTPYVIWNPEDINCGYLSVNNKGLHPHHKDTYREKVTGELFEATYDELMSAPSIQRVPKKQNMDVYLDTLLGAEWREIIQQVEISNHSVPVLGTDMLEAMYQFHENGAFLVEGRSLSEEDYAQGNRVCIISETLAASSGLTVGDRVDLSFYWGASWTDDMLDSYVRGQGANIASHPYNRKVGFSAEDMSFEIVGLYRQKEQWLQCSREWWKNETLRTNPYVFTPNTVFVPSKALENVPTYTEESDLFFTMVLYNGTVEETKAFLRDNGYLDNKLLYFDNGYSEIAETLNGFQESAKQLFYASVLTWLAAVVVYLVLFVRHQRRSVGLMCSLGSGKGKAARFVWVISMLPVAAASVVGALVGMALMRGTLEKVFASVQDVLSTDFSSTAGGHISIESTLVALPWTAAVAALAQALVLAGVIWLCARALASRKPLDNIRTGGK